jgi:hypothetical protein
MKSCALFIMLAALGATLLAEESVPRPVTGAIQPGTYNLATDHAPAALTLRETGLKEAGLAAGEFFPQADEIRIFPSKDRMNESPKARIWLNAREGGQYWYHTGGSGSAAEHRVEKGEALVIYTRISTNTLTWANPFRPTP